MNKKIFLKTFGCPNVQVCRDDIGAVKEDKWFGMKEI